MAGRFMLTPRAHYSHSDYDQTHPIFNTTRKVDSYGASLAASYLGIFNRQDFSLMALLGISQGDNNIDFYDNESLTCGLFINYHF